MPKAPRNDVAGVTMQRPSTSRGASAQRVKAGGSNRELFTPLSGRRLPSSLARGGGGSGHASGSAMSVRRSSFLNRMAMGRSAAKGGEKTKDTRPLHDKIYFQKSTKQLCEFLLEQGFESQLINPRKLQNPTTHDILQIFSFLYQMIEPHYGLIDKYEEEIPRLLKDLQYPFPLTKSSMYTIAAPHTWPQVLGALTWLMETVKLYQRCCTNMSLYGNDESAGIFDKEEKREQKCTELFNNYVDMTYIQFLQGADDGGAAKRDLSRQIKGVHEMDELLVHELEREKHQFEEDLANIENMKAEAPEKLKALHQDLQQWLQKQENLQKYISEMESHKSSLRQRLDTVESTILETDLEHQKETALVDHIKIQLEAQTLPPCKVEKLKQQLKDLETAEVELTRAAEENDFQFSLEEKAATLSEVGAPFLNRDYVQSVVLHGFLQAVISKSIV
uniref:Kinetochore protein NDC80 n=2 Tax=Eptatretus burgeri TaxID=7764 RepID=A0A8C4QET9_EPTBU